MRIKLTAGLILFFFGLHVFALPEAGAKEDFARTTVETPPSEQLIVKFSSGTSSAQKRAVKRAIGAVDQVKITPLTEPGEQIELIAVDSRRPARETAARLEKRRDVEFAEPNHFRSASLTPNDTYYSLQWGLAKISAPAAWDISTGSAETTIAVIDTGVDYNHPDLAGKVIRGPDYFNDDTDPMDDSGHGTHVAGIAAAVSNNGAGVAGVSWNSKILAIKALGWIGGYDFDIAQGIIYAADNGADVINLSLGGSEFGQTMKNAVDYAASKGAVLVAATGNSDSSVMYPAAYENVIGVGATNSSDARTSPAEWGEGAGSNYGPEVDLVAPGDRIASTYPGSAYAYMSGTSMASPHVAGAAAVVLSKDGSLAPADVEQRLTEAATDLGDPGRDDYYGHGRVELAEALSGTTERLYGQTSAGTAAAISQAGWATSNLVILARDDYFSDALTAASLAYTYAHDPSLASPVPILLTAPTSLSSEALSEMKRLGATTAIVVGGPGAVADTVLEELRANGIAPDRIWQNSSYGTAADVARRMAGNSAAWGSFDRPDTAVLATGENFPDSIAVASPAAANNMPVLLTKPNSLTPETLTALQELGISNVIIVGGPAAVTAAVENELAAAGIAITTRLWGNSHFDTAVDIATDGNA
ncbi:MAG: S8 family serine peptidase, partial [Terriglobia bacterium]